MAEKTEVTEEFYCLYLIKCNYCISSIFLMSEIEGIKGTKKIYMQNIECNNSEYQVFAVCFSFICVYVVCFTEICTDLTVLAGDCGMDIKFNAHVDSREVAGNVIEVFELRRQARCMRVYDFFSHVSLSEFFSELSH